MRWKLLRRRLSVSAPRVIVRSHLPWPLRWAVAALMLGFSAAIALWAFEFGKEIAGLERGAKEELASLRTEVASLRSQGQAATAVANTAESLLRTERAAQERLAQQVRQLEAEKAQLESDLRFFERLLPATGSGVQLRGLRTETVAPGQLRYQMLVMQSSRAAPPFDGRYEIMLSGQLEGKPWALPMPDGPLPLKLKQYARVEGTLEFPPEAVIKGVQARVIDAKGVTRATQTVNP